MRILGALILSLLIFSLISGCANFRNENPLKVKCPSCGYIWDHSVTEEY